MLSRIKNSNIFIVYFSLVFAAFILFSLASFYHILLISPDTVDGKHFKLAILSSPGFWKDLLHFLSSVLSLHLIWTIALWSGSAGWLKKIAMPARQKNLICALVFLISFLFLLIWSSRNYPNMSSGFMAQSPIMLSDYVFYGLLLIIILSTFISLALLGKNWRPGAIKFIGAAAFVVLSLGVLWAGFGANTTRASFNHLDKPNILIIGIDSLRPDETGYFGSEMGLTPNVDKFLNNSQVFDKAYTPYARTFPAWMSLLSGQEPVNHKGRFNLINQRFLDKKSTLPAVMRELGYKTVFAFDERRFNNMDESFGYDAVIGPELGALGFVLSKYDHPLVNLLCNTKAGKYLFPQMYLNRGRNGNYDPEKYNAAIIEELTKSTEKPVLLTAHFLLPHWPWLSRDTGDVESFNELEQSELAQLSVSRYREMVREVDQQFGQFMQELEKSGVLDNAQVFLFSDHGDGFALERDRLKAAGTAPFELETDTRGHATNVLNLGQYRVVLAAQSFGKQQVFKPGLTSGDYSLMDVYPTILDLLKVERPDANFDGVSLFAEGQQKRTLYFETGFTFLQLTQDEINENEVIREGFSAYTVDKKGRLVVKDSYEKLILESKHRAVMEDGWMLAMIPGMGKYLVLVDVNKQEWWSALNYDGPVDWKKMLGKMCAHYQGDIGFDPEDACSLALVETDKLSLVH